MYPTQDPRILQRIIDNLLMRIQILEAIINDRLPLGP